jgi:hypothetical protein
MVGYSAETGCSDYFTVPVSRANIGCDRPNFDMAGFHFLQTRASDSDISVMLQAMADGLQLHPVVPKFRNADYYVNQECNASRDVICEECQA